VVHAFTTAMRPRNKESARLHPREFALGLVLHAGVLLALADVSLLIAAPRAVGILAPLLLPCGAMALAAAVALAIRRCRSPVLMAMSSADDHVAIGAVGGLLALSLLHHLGVVAPTVLLGFAALVLIYLPLGKLRHALFFFVARAEYGSRLGHRGVYPPTRSASQAGSLPGHPEPPRLRTERAAGPTQEVQRVLRT
jgi:hypothetical protein